MHMEVDERASAFMALGYGRATGTPAIWITTSGTALANGYPAIVEASMEAVPMLLLTADRPPELRDTDANQTIRQDHLFGQHVRWFFDMPTPSSDIAPSWVLSTLDEAVRKSSDGPVHLNCAFRKPLHPDADDMPDREQSLAGIPDDSGEHAPAFSNWLASDAPFTRFAADPPLAESTLSGIDRAVRMARRPLILLGRLRGGPETIRENVALLAAEWGAVIAADINSQIRLGPSLDAVIPFMDALLYGDTLDGLEPDIIIQFGASPVSRRLLEWAPEAERIVIDGRPRRIDPGSRGGLRVVADGVSVLDQLAHFHSDSPRTDRGAWMASWIDVAARARAWEMEAFGFEMTEQQAARVFVSQLPDGASLTIASSNPVRHVDTFVRSSRHLIPVSTNRGASGIDGTLATACGFADGTETRPAVLIGDLALMHDMTSLDACARRNAVVVVINNDGGGIFSYLPIREHGDTFETWFGTPHGHTFEPAAVQFGLSYERPGSLEELEAVLEAAFAGSMPVLIEVLTERDTNLEEQRRLLRSLQQEVKG